MIVAESVGVNVKYPFLPEAMVKFSQQDEVFANYLLAIAAGGFFALSLMYASWQTSEYVLPVSSSPILEQIPPNEIDIAEAVEQEIVPEEEILPELEKPPEVQKPPEDVVAEAASRAPTPFPLYVVNHTSVTNTTPAATSYSGFPVEFQEATSPPVQNSSTTSSSTTSSVTYYSSSGGGGGGGGSSHHDNDDDDDPEPKPDPKPEPDDDPKPDDDQPKTKGLHGVNFIDAVLNRKEHGPKLSVQKEFVDTFVQTARESNFNLFRVPVTWEAYTGNEANFLAELDYLVESANENKISVWIDFHHFFATSNWGSKIAKGEGFPELVVSCYKPTKGYERDPEVRAFWDDYYLNKVRDSGNDCKPTLDVWTLQAGFMKDVANEIDHYPNVLGYEILNEPHVWKDTHYEQLGTMHTEVAEKLRTVTDKTLIFTRETPHGFDSDGHRYKRQPQLEYLILPKDPDNNVIYTPHLYALKDIEKQVKTWKAVQEKWESMGYDVEIGVGEWATQSPQLPKDKAVTQENMDAFVKVWSREGYMHTYWAYGAFAVGDGNALVNKNGHLKEAGKLYENSIIKLYDITDD